MAFDKVICHYGQHDYLTLHCHVGYFYSFSPGRYYFGQHGNVITERTGVIDCSDVQLTLTRLTAKL